MVPFKVGRWLGLQVDVDGIAIISEKGIQLTFNDPQRARKLWEAETETVLVRWTEIASWQVSYGFLSDQICLQVTSATVFGSLPGVHV